MVPYQVPLGSEMGVSNVTWIDNLKLTVCMVSACKDMRAPPHSERFIVFELWDCDTLEDNDYIGAHSACC